MEIEWSGSTIKITQRQYLDKILKRFNCENAKSVATPMQENLKEVASAPGDAPVKFFLQRAHRIPVARHADKARYSDGAFETFTESRRTKQGGCGWGQANPEVLQWDIEPWDHVRRGGSFTILRSGRRQLRQGEERKIKDRIRVLPSGGSNHQQIASHRSSIFLPEFTGSISNRGGIHFRLGSCQERSLGDRSYERATLRGADASPASTGQPTEHLHGSRRGITSPHNAYLRQRSLAYTSNAKQDLRTTIRGNGRKPSTPSHQTAGSDEV
jgi:hypothetical protein